MKQLSPSTKHSILLEYRPYSTTHSFAALARRHGVAGGGEVVRRWHQRWDGSAASLQRRKGGGRPRSLSSRQVQQHVRAPILAANRAHKSLHYTKLLPAVRRKTGNDLSIQTLRRYGKEELGAKQRRGKKRTAEESECIHTGKDERTRLLIEQSTHKVAALPLLVQCLLICVSRSRRCDVNCSASASVTSSSSMRL